MISMDSEVTIPDQAMASMTLKQSPFHRQEVWEEKEEKMADDKGPSLINVPTGNKSLQQLTASNVPRKLSSSGDLLKEKEGASRMREKPVRVPQLA